MSGNTELVERIARARLERIRRKQVRLAVKAARIQAVLEVERVAAEVKSLRADVDALLRRTRALSTALGVAEQPEGRVPE